MSPAEFFVAVYDFVDYQDKCREHNNNATKQNRKLNEEELSDFAKLQELTNLVKTELHKVDQKSEQTYYLLAKKKIAMLEMKDKLGLEPA